MHKGSCSLALAVVLVVLPATFARADDYARPTFYLGIGFAGAVENFQNTGPLDIEDGIGLNARAGYRVHPNIAAELSFEWIDGFDFEQIPATLETWALTANAKAYALTGRIQPYALVGIGVMQVDTRAFGRSFGEKEDFVVRLGGGLDVYATEHILLSIDISYMLPRADIGALEYASFGIGPQIRF